MRLTAAFRLLLVPAFALLGTACDDTPSPQEPLIPSEEAPGSEALPSRQDLASLVGDRAHWADGYLLGSNPLTATYSPPSASSFNRSGDGINITKPAGTTGRYIATFGGLSAFLGARSTVQVTAFTNATIGGPEETYCKPVGASLASDKVEIRCYKTGTGVPVNATFTLLVTRNYSDLAFAYAHQPTGTNYSPAASGSWNPAGTSKVARSGVGQYQVVFNNLGSQLPSGVGGHVQVNAVGTGKAHCKADSFGGTVNLTVSVKCYTPAGALVDSKFSVLFLLPTDHLAYAWGDQPTSDSYTPFYMYASNPGTGGVYITRFGVGIYTVSWQGADPEIFDLGNPQATAYGQGSAQCKVTSFGSANGSATATVRCFAANGAPTDSYYMVLLGS